MKRISLLAAVLALVAVAPARGAAPVNPFTAANGAATMHADSASSDVSPFPGPALSSATVQSQTLAAACPAILQGSDGIPIALCTAIADRRPTIYELNPRTGAPVAQLQLAAGNLFGGVYTYLDQENRLVLFDASGNLIRVAHQAQGAASLTIVSSIPTADALNARCPSLCGGIVGLAPDWRGRVWFATAQGVAGFVDPATRAVQTIALGQDEQVANSISTSPGGTAVATDHALYLLSAAHTGRPTVVWRAAYDRGPARKPGQLSHGSGATPTFFGPGDGSRYLAITDNAAPAEHLLVYDTQARVKRKKVARVVCDLPVLTPGPSGTENSPVGYDRSVYVASSYGYPYPASPSGAEPTQPASAPFAGGVTRVDLKAGGGCATRWQVPVRSAAVPRLDAPSGLLYTVERSGPQGTTTSPLDSYAEVSLDAGTGAVAGRTMLGAGYLADTLQLAPSIVPGHVLYQGTISGLVRISS